MDSLWERLHSRTIFKFIVGIGNCDPDDIGFFTRVYTAAGADIVDVAARPDVVAATHAAVHQALLEFPHHDAPPKIMVSVALARDPHVRQAGLGPAHRSFIAPADTSALMANVAACLHTGADQVEIHASDSEDAALKEAVEAVSAVLGGGYLSVCLGADGWRSPRDVIRQAEMVRAIHGPRTMIQAEGIALAKDGAPASSVQGLALAQTLLAKTTAFVLVAGGANYWTRNLTELLGIPIHGIASGSYARQLVAGFKGPGPIVGDLEAAVRVARRFARHAKGGRAGEI